MTTGKHPPVKPEDVENLIELFKQSDWDEMHVQVGEFELFLSNDPSAPGLARSATAAASVAAPAPAASVPTAAPAAPTHAAAHEASIPDGMLAIRAPNLGTFYRAPKPGALPYVELGQVIDADVEVCLIEVMKLFAPVRAGIKGTVREVRATDGMMVEFGQILFIVEPAA